MGKAVGRGWSAIRAVLPSTVFVALIGIPLFMVFARSGLGEGSFRLHPALGAVTLFTLKQAATSLAVALVLGAAFGGFSPLAESPRLKRILLSIFSLPSLSVAGGLLALSHAMGGAPGLGWIIAAHAYLNAPWIALAVIEAREAFPVEWNEAARSLGAGKRVVFTRFFLPWVSERLLVASAQVFSFCAMSFAIVFLLGGGPPASTLETEIFILVRGSGVALGDAAQFALAQLLLAGVPLFFAAQYRFKNRRTVDRSERADRSGGKRMGWSVYSLLAVLFLAFPLFSLGFSAFSDPQTWTGEFWAGIARDPDFSAALMTSASIAGLTMAVSLLLSSLFVFSGGAKSGRLLAGLSGVPSGMSPFVLCLGFFLAYSSGGWIDVIDPFEGSRTAIVLIQSVLLLPFGTRFLLPIREEARELSRRRLRFMARSLGAGRWRSWVEVDWPRIREGVVPFLRMAGAWSFMDVTVASFFASEELFTLPVWLARKLTRYEFAVSQSVLFLVTAFLVIVFLSGIGEKRAKKG
jgi:thiamine transport system permease protein